MIQDVKLGTHKIGTYNMYVIKKCAFLLGFYLEMPLRSDPLVFCVFFVNTENLHALKH